MTNNKLVLCYTRIVETTPNLGCTDHFEIFDTFDKAIERYEELLLQDDLYSASICNPIVSTEPHYIGDK